MEEKKFDTRGKMHTRAQIFFLSFFGFWNRKISKRLLYHVDHRNDLFVGHLHSKQSEKYTIFSPLWRRIRVESQKVHLSLK